MELRNHFVANPLSQYGDTDADMLDVMLLKTALSALSTLFGSLGVFLVYLSFLKPALGMYAVFFLGIAMAILHSTTPK
jgi:hypothetical protein